MARRRPAPIELVLEPGTSAIGRVLGTREEPLAGARVILIADTGSRDLALDRLPPLAWATETDADGRFRFDDLPSGACLLVASARGFADLTIPGLLLEHTETPGDLGELLLERGWGLEGEVSDPWSNPVEGAAVTARRTDLERRPIRVDGFDGDLLTRTDRHGRFRIEGVPSGAVLELELYQEPYRLRKLAGVRPDREPWLRVAFELDGRIVGRVVDAQRRGVGGVEVFLEQAGDGPDVSSEQTNARGEFAFASLAPGEARISARAAHGIVAPEPVIIDGRGEPVEVVLELEQGLTIAGKVLDADDELPIAYALVVAHPHRGSGDDDDSSPGVIPAPVEAWTGEDGRFVLEGLAPGRYDVVCELTGYARQVEEVRVEPGMPALVSCLLSPHDPRIWRRISGRVVAADGQPVGGATVRLLDTVRGSELRRVTSWPDGSFELRTRPPGLLRLSAHHRGLASASSDTLELLDQDITGVELRLTSGGTIAGRILNVQLAELGAIEVVARSGEGARYRGEVAWDGSYRIEDLPAGEWSITAITPTRRHTHPEKQTLLGDGHHLRLDLPLGDGASWRGEVSFAGRQAAGVKIDVRCPEVGLSFSVTSRDDGSFVLDDLPNFGCRLRLGHGGAHQHLELLLDGGRLVRLDGGVVVEPGATELEVVLSPR